ncbi:hypothetical protein FHS31_001209 [Sphingomonas vulcanisoli]|uniref:Uncharacterized protein n=1 Tax=Sphingomonas vulcanisoli TaxID=1658060 RepID=A0ABX0TPZ6_9SPHN|nr:hypothetical protein [Sphingomonas vulcanisoli]NIJ07613.1 hypothetical protein [Sphingomonas vulcanisoli]
MKLGQLRTLDQGTFAAVIGSGIIIILLVMMWIISVWSGTRTAQKDDIIKDVATLPSNCRHTAAQIIRSQIVGAGRPLTRGEVSEQVSSLHSDCHALAEQASALDTL